MTENAKACDISIFDVDRTLTRKPTYSLFLIEAARACSPCRLALIPFVLLAMIAFKLGLLTRKQLKETMHRLMLGRRIKRERIEPVALAFAQKIFNNGLHSEARAQIDHDRADGRRIMLASAAPSLYLDALAELLHVDLLACSPSSWEGPCLTYHIDGENCYGEDKLESVRRILFADGAPRNRFHIRFYSDDASDLPMLEWVDEPIAVNPSKTLERIAQQRGWKILDWRLS